MRKISLFLKQLRWRELLNNNFLISEWKEFQAE